LVLKFTPATGLAMAALLGLVVIHTIWFRNLVGKGVNLQKVGYLLLKACSDRQRVLKVLVSVSLDLGLNNTIVNFHISF